MEDNNKTNLIETGKQPKTNPSNTNKVTKNANVEKLCKQYGVEEIYQNSKGELFTKINYALSSEKGDKTKIKTLKP